MKKLSIPFWSLLSAGYSRVGSEWNYRDVCSPFTRLYYVTEGCGEVHMPDRTLYLRPGYLYIVPAFTRHSNRCEYSMTHYYVHVYEEVEGYATATTDRWVFPDSIKANLGTIETFKELIRFNPQLSLKNPDPKIYDNTILLRDSLNRDSCRPLTERLMNNGLISLLMALWLGNGQETMKTKNDRIVRVMGYIHRNLFSDFEVEDCAREVSLSKYHLLRLFKIETGTSIMSYVRFLRMRRAQIELVLTDKPIKQIAYELGYKDFNYFIRLFKKQTGATPGAYRRQNFT